MDTMSKEALEAKHATLLLDDESFTTQIHPTHHRALGLAGLRQAPFCSRGMASRCRGPCFFFLGEGGQGLVSIVVHGTWLGNDKWKQTSTADEGA